MIYEQKPPIASVSRTRKGYHTTINFNIRETDGGFDADSVTITTTTPITSDDYGVIVSAIVRCKYSADEVEAIVNNYLLAKTDASENDMSEMQGWRALAKETAKSVLQYVAGNKRE